MKLLKTVTAPGDVVLNDLTPGHPVLLIHQYQSASGSYASQADCRIIVNVVSGDAGGDKLDRCLGAYLIGNAAYHANQCLIFMPVGTSMTIKFSSHKPPTKTNRVLIFH